MKAGREKRGFSQENAAERAGVGEVTWYRWEGEAAFYLAGEGFHADRLRPSLPSRSNGGKANGEASNEPEGSGAKPEGSAPVDGEGEASQPPSEPSGDVTDSAPTAS